MLFTKYELSKKHEIEAFEGPIYLHEEFLEKLKQTDWTTLIR